MVSIKNFRMNPETAIIASIFNQDSTIYFGFFSHFRLNLIDTDDYNHWHYFQTNTKRLLFLGEQNGLMNGHRSQNLISTERYDDGENYHFMCVVQTEKKTPKFISTCVHIFSKLDQIESLNRIFGVYYKVFESNKYTPGTYWTFFCRFYWCLYVYLNFLLLVHVHMLFGSFINAHVT